VYVPVAVNCWLVPAATDAVPGLTAIDRSSGAVTAMLVELVTVPELALILAVPIAVPITSPPAFTSATEGASEAQVTEAVTSCLLPSVYVPVAVNGWLVPSGIAAFIGEIAIETNAGLATVMVVEEETDAEVAVMVAMPCPELVANP